MKNNKAQINGELGFWDMKFYCLKTVTQIFLFFEHKIHDGHIG